MALTRLLRKLNSNLLHRRQKSLIRNGDWLRLIKAHHKNQNIRDKSCGKQKSFLHEICYLFLLRNWFVTQNNPILPFNSLSSSATLIYNVGSLRQHPTFRDVTTSYPTKWNLKNERRNSILMVYHYPDLRSAFDWSCRDGNLVKFSSTNRRHYPQIEVVTRHQYGITDLVCQASFGGKPEVASRNVGCFLRLV